MIATARITATDFKRIATAMNWVIERRNTIPVLAEVRVDISAGKATFRGTDLDMCLTMEAEAETDGKASFLINGAQMAGFASAMSDHVQINYQDADMGALNKQRVVELRTDGLTLRSLDRIPAEDFPIMNFADDKNWRAGARTFSATQDQLQRVLSLGRHCISTENTLYYLNGAYLHTKPDGNTLRGVTTDGHRMAVVDTPIELSDDVGILPTKLVDITKRLLSANANEPVGAQFKDTRLVLTLPDIELASKLIDGTYPDYTRVIPSADGKGEAQVSKASVARLAAIANTFGQRFTAVKFDLENKMMSMVSPERDEVTAPLQSRGDFAIGVNIKYLTAQANVTPSFTMQALSSRDPIRCVGTDPDALFVLMPMRV